MGEATATHSGNVERRPESAPNPRPEVVLASASTARASLLRRAGVSFAVETAAVDEDEIKRTVAAEGADADHAAGVLAEIKASRVSRRHPQALVIGADQILDCGGVWFDKPGDLAAARCDLLALRGREHTLATAACVVSDGAVLWRHGCRARLVMRTFSARFLDSYLETAGEAVLASAGAYQLEDLGGQLFSKVDGDYFSILGLPLLPLLGFLRGHGVVEE